MRRLTGFLFSIAAVFATRAQQTQTDTIYLMNGNIVAEEVIDTLLGAITIYDPEKPRKKIHYTYEQLYMVSYRDGFRRYYYVQDSTMNNWFSRDEMWMYTKGERDARKSFKARGSFIGSVIAGFTGGMTGTIWGPAAPYGYMALSGIPRVRMRSEYISDPRYVDSDAYILGFERVARQKRKLQSLIGGTIGLAAGYGFYALFHRNYPEQLDIGFNR